MKKIKSTDMLLEPIDYWENKLSINYKTEYIRYKKLCAKLNKKEVYKLDGIYYMTYSDWENHMTDKIKHLDYHELYEYVHFLNNLSRHSNTTINLTQVILLPLSISFLSLFILDPIRQLLLSPTWSGCIVAFISFVYLFIIIKYLATTSKDDALQCSFYSDLMILAKQQLSITQNPDS